MSLEDVTAGAQILGIAGDAPVTVVAVTWIMRLHRHKEAIRAARTGKSYVLTTGTGSGKGLAYIIHIVRRVLEAMAERSYRPWSKAIIVYPMNALANSRFGQLEEFRGTANKVVHHDG
jgi:ATP-dependent helicase YprA (DUF1998 family)